ncbi:MAG: hypothetical protein EDS66_16020 [Planctomycetota bacterium]|nr:MAG: hypothetical protein EDS66_16020 [Planctomycetota bacterium]
MRREGGGEGSAKDYFFGFDFSLDFGKAFWSNEAILAESCSVRRRFGGGFAGGGAGRRICDQLFTPSSASTEVPVALGMSDSCGEIGKADTRVAVPLDGGEEAAAKISRLDDGRFVATRMVDGLD